MGLEFLSDARFVKVAGFHFTRSDLGGELACCLGNLRARTVIECDNQSQPAVPGRSLDGSFQPLDEIRTEGRIIPDQLEPNLLLLEGLELALQIEAHEGGQVGDLFGAASPVLRRESIERQHLDAVVGGGLERAAHGLGAGAMACNARKPPLLRPAPVAVHDDGDVPRHGARDRLTPVQSLCALGGGSRAHLPRISFSLDAAASSTSLIVSSVSFCTSCSSRLRSSSLMSCFFSSCLR